MKYPGLLLSLVFFLACGAGPTGSKCSMADDCATKTCFEGLCRVSCVMGTCQGTAVCQEGLCIDLTEPGQTWMVGVTRVFQVPPGNEVNEPEPIACISAGSQRACSAEGSGVDAEVDVALAVTTDELADLQLDVFENDSLLGTFTGCESACDDLEAETFEHPISVVVDVRPPLRRVHRVRLDHFELLVSP